MLNLKPMTMFDNEFFPTPRNVIDRMGIDPKGKICLEPSAGKGDIVDYLHEFGAKKVLTCEVNQDLRKILQHKSEIIGDDFFDMKAEHLSHIQSIYMNPPFSNAEKHILHAWAVAPEGCEVIALCNWETLDNHFHNRRKELNRLINEYGSKEFLGDCFATAERKTGVEVGLVKLFKPVVSETFDFEGFYFDCEASTPGEGILKYDEIRAVVNSYVAAVNCFDRVKEVSEELNRYTQVTNFGSGFSFSAGHKEEIVHREQFQRTMQKHCWKHIFNKMKIDKYVTTGVMKDINKFVELQTAYPFTMRNIYKMIEIIVGTRGNTMNRAIVEAIDNITMYTHENRFNHEGWKTNSGYMINKKFIANGISEMAWKAGYLHVREWQPRFIQISDLVKALCYITGTDYSVIDKITLASASKNENGNWIRTDGTRIDNENHFIPNKWYDWGFFEFKVYKKGTGHFKFKDERVWEQLNRAYAKAKGQVLPEKI